jgi:PadR family transcriptional regulator AphA
MKKLTPTSYALLGLLARRPWSAYELNVNMQTSVIGAFWPRAASHVYSEPKKLVTLKLATAKQEQLNGRDRTVYKITAAGLKTLQDWLASPTESYVTLSFEAMLKFLYAASGDKKTLEANLDDIEQGTLRAAAAILEGVRPMATEQSQSTEGMPYNGMALNFLADVIEAELAWVKAVRVDLDKLKHTRSGEQSTQMGLESYQQLIGRLERIVDSNKEED